MITGVRERSTAWPRIMAGHESWTLGHVRCLAGNPHCCNFLSQNVSTLGIRHICDGVLGEHRDVRAEALSRFDDMSSKGFDSGEAKRSLRVGVIGAGVMGSNHARVLAGLPDTTLVGVVDPLPAHRDRANELTGCRSFASLDDLVAEGIDAVTIAAPTHLHHEIALACIARAVHVLVEKPIASSVEEGRDIVDAARRAGVTLMVGHVERFNPAVAAIKAAISGEDILSIAITRVGPFPPRMSNVGVVIDLAVHDIDLIRWFTESDIVEVQPQLSSAVAEREDIALLQFRTASGVLAHINTNWLTPFKARNVTVATRGKYIMGDLLTRQVAECFGFKP